MLAALQYFTGEQRKPTSQSPIGERKSHKWISSLAFISDIKKEVSKDAPHHLSSWKFKLKQQGTTTHLLEWQKSKTLTTPNAGKDAEQQEFPFIAGGNAKCTVTLEDSLAVSYKAKHTLTI